MSASSNPKVRLAVMASGHGSNFQAILDACAAGEIHGEVVALVTNKRHAGAVARARKAKVETLIFEPEKFGSRTVMCAKIAKALKDRKVDYVCLAGYMLKIEPCLVRRFPERILNIHPALLPKYGGKGMYGERVHKAVIDAGDRESGCTVHVVDDFYDHGPALAQARVKVEPDDTPSTLAKKIQKEEHKLYVEVLKKICAGDLNIVAPA